MHSILLPPMSIAEPSVQKRSNLLTKISNSTLAVSLRRYPVHVAHSLSPHGDSNHLELEFVPHSLPSEVRIRRVVVYWVVAADRERGHRVVVAGDFGRGCRQRLRFVLAPRIQRAVDEAASAADVGDEKEDPFHARWCLFRCLEFLLLGSFSLTVEICPLENNHFVLVNVHSLECTIRVYCCQFRHVLILQNPLKLLISEISDDLIVRWSLNGIINCSSPNSSANLLSPD